MKHKILIAYDGTEYSLKAVEYVANVVKLSPDNYEVALLFVMPPIPVSFVEYGDLPGKEEESAELMRRREILNELKKDTENLSEKVFIKAKALLKTYNFANVLYKFSHCTADIAGEIIKEVESDIYKTVVIGRKGGSSLKDRLMGGTAEKVIRYVKNRTVWVVE